MEIVLASASGRRKRLLKSIVKRFSVKPADVNERIGRRESFSTAAVRLAVKKAKAVAKKEKGAIVVGADTIAYIGKKNFRKTDEGRVARGVLSFLSGKTHYVVTGVAVIFPGGRVVKYAVKAAVKMKKLSKKELAAYLKSGEWKGRAGCYDVSGRGARLVACINGEKETVVGLPISRLAELLG